MTHYIRTKDHMRTVRASILRFVVSFAAAASTVHAQRAGSSTVSTGIREPARLVNEIADRSTVGAVAMAGRKPTYFVQPNFASADGTSIFGGTIGVSVPARIPFQLRVVGKLSDVEPESRKTIGADAKLKLLTGVRGFDLAVSGLFQQTLDVANKTSGTASLDYTIELPSASDWTVGVGVASAFVRTKASGDSASASTGGTLSSAARVGFKNTELELNYQLKSDIEGADDFSVSIAHKLTSVRYKPLIVAGGGKGKVGFLTLVFYFP